MKRFKNIHYFADGNHEPGPALERAVALANANDARLTVTDVIEQQETSPQIETTFGSDLNEILREHRRQALEEMVRPFNESDTIIYTQVLTGTPFLEVVKSVLTSRYDLVIKTCRPPEGLSEHLLGSTDMHLMRKCPCPVWIDRPTAATPYRRILAAVDPVHEESKECARLVMNLATSLAERESAGLAVVHAWRVYGESMLRSGRGRISQEQLEQKIEQTRQCHSNALDALLEAYGLGTRHPDVHLLKGNPATTIHTLSGKLDVDLVGRRPAEYEGFSPCCKTLRLRVPGCPGPDGIIFSNLSRDMYKLHVTTTTSTGRGRSLDVQSEAQPQTPTLLLGGCKSRFNHEGG